MAHPIFAAGVALAALLSLPPTVETANVVTVSARDFAFTAPSTLPAGRTTFRLVNQGKEMHHLTVIRLQAGKTMADFLAAAKAPGAPPAWAIEVGGPGPAVPGHGSDATIDLEPGRYLLACFVPSPGSPMPHMMKGMLKEFVVTGAASKSAEPAADIDVVLGDYSFGFNRKLTAGRHTVRVRNGGRQPHEMVIVKLPPGKKIGEVAAWVDGMMQGPPPGMPMGGMSPLAPGHSSTFTIDMTPGTYGLICFLPDAKDGKPHTSHGMMQQIEVAAK